MGRVQDQGWHLDGKEEDLPFFEGNEQQALHLWGRSETRVGGWHCYLPFLEQRKEGWSERAMENEGGGWQGIYGVVFIELWCKEGKERIKTKWRYKRLTWNWSWCLSHTNTIPQYFLFISQYFIKCLIKSFEYFQHSTSSKPRRRITERDVPLSQNEISKTMLEREREKEAYVWERMLQLILLKFFILFFSFWNWHSFIPIFREEHVKNSFRMVC